MKRAIALLILVSCFVGNIACAEEINLPNGLQFGMNISEAIAVSGYPRSQLDAGNKAYYNAYGVSFLEDCIQQNVVIGGMDAEMLVLFDGNGLCQIRYRFSREDVDKEKANTPGELISASHQAVETSLNQKYGEALDATKNRHMYMPPVGQSVSWSFVFVLEEFGYRDTSSFTATALIPTLRIVKMADGSSVCIDNYIKAQTNGVQYHELTYTYYGFEIGNTTQSNSIDF